MPSEELVLTYVTASDYRTIELLIDQGTRASWALGLLPQAVYYEAASENRLLAAWHGSEPVGHALIRLSRDRVTLTQLCVREDFRGRGVALWLVNEVGVRHRERLGLLAKYRDDHPNSAQIWRGLGRARRLHRRRLRPAAATVTPRTALVPASLWNVGPFPRGGGLVSPHDHFTHTPTTSTVLLPPPRTGFSTVSSCPSRTLADIGDTLAAAQLVDLLTDAGDPEALRVCTDTGDVPSVLWSRLTDGRTSNDPRT